LFEPSTEIIRKGKAGKPNEFGKMVKLQEAEDQIVIDYEVYDQRPSDSNLLVPAIETHQEMLGRTPHLVAADAAFSVVKRRHGLNRCRYKGENGMKRWVGLGVISDNPINIGRAIAKQTAQTAR
jgi:transposase, IS5 family